MTRAVVVGSGPNGLAAAIVLADAGLEVTVLESADRVGGGTRSSALTVPGLLHDDCSGFHPFTVDNRFTRQFDLTRHGLEWRWPEVQYSHPLDGGRGAAAVRSVVATADRLGSDGRRWQRTFGPLSDQFGAISDEFLRPVFHRPHHPLAFGRFGILALPSIDRAARRWTTTEARALFGGVAAHGMRPFGGVLTSAIGMALATAAHRYGWPVAAGGSASITRAMVTLLGELGGTVTTGVRVDSLAELEPADVIMLDVAPAAAARIAADRMPARVARAYRRYRHGPGAFKVDFAVADGVPWTHEPSRRAGTVHVAGSFEEVRDAELLVHRGVMPERPFVLVGQQYVADPTRSHGDLHPLYAYAHVPAGFTGDATAAIEAQIERFAPGFGDRIQARHVRPTWQLERDNANYVGGDITTGANSPGQLLGRPRFALDPYSTGIDGTYLCSAATPPGAGAHGMCGYEAAQSALRHLTTGRR